MNTIPHEFCFWIKSSTHYLEALRRLVSAIVDSIPVEKQTDNMKMRCTLALTESVNNSVFHAHMKCEKKWIRMGWKISETCLQMRVEDGGKGLFLKNATLPDSLASHGRGLFLIQNVMDRVTLRSVKGRQVLTMTCFFKKR